MNLLISYNKSTDTWTFDVEFRDFKRTYECPSPFSEAMRWFQMRISNEAWMYCQTTNYADGTSAVEELYRLLSA